MNRTNKLRVFFQLFLSFIVFGNLFALQKEGAIAQSGEELRKEAMKIRYNNPDSSIQLLQESYELFLKSKDTVNATKVLLEVSYLFVNNAKYANSYDALWKALLLNDKTDDGHLKSIIYNRLGRLYSYNKRIDESINYLGQSLELQKNRIEHLNLNNSDLAPFYYSLAKTHRELGNIEVARSYMDSCYTYYPKDAGFKSMEFLEFTNKAYLDFENAIILSKGGQANEALKVLDEIYPWFQENQPSYLVLIYKHWGDIYLEINDLAKSKEFYDKSLMMSEKYNSHVDFTPLVHEKLAEWALKANDYKSAFENIKAAKDLDANFFDARSSGNLSLLEIKDTYRLEKQKQQQLIQQQHLKQLHQEEEISNLQRIILLGSIIFLLVIGYVYFRHLRAKHDTEKQLIRRNKELEIEKTKELLELKNKELAVSALQLIEKEEFLKTLKTKVRSSDDKIKVHEVNKVLKSISASNNQNWEEFKLRFIDVNKDFYNKIFEKYPNLSQGDQKICALIKLNFSSKEMSRLLGISVESVHTSRHRIRKKMSLPRSANLEDYINSI